MKINWKNLVVVLVFMLFSINCIAENFLALCLEVNGEKANVKCTIDLTINERNGYIIISYPQKLKLTAQYVKAQNETGCSYICNGSDGHKYQVNFTDASIFVKNSMLINIYRLQNGETEKVALYSYSVYWKENHGE